MQRTTRARKSASASQGKVTIRPAREKDLKDCARILHTKELAGPGGWYPTAHVLKNCLGKYFLLAEADGRILGCSVVEPLRRGVIGWWFAVAKGARGKGVGSALLDATERAAKREGKFFFLTYSKAGSRAVKFYRNRGFEVGQDFTELIKMIQ